MYIREKLGIRSREELWEYIKSKQKKPLQNGLEAIRSIREEK